MRERPQILDAAKHYYERLAIFERETVTPGGIVLLGSSHFEWFDTDRFLPGRHIVNRGIASDRLGITDRGILHRLDISVFDLQPCFVLINNAVNDIGELVRTGEPPVEQIYEAYERVIVTIRTRIPDVPLLIVNELPTTGRFADLNPYIPPLNEHIKQVADRHNCDHLDFYSEVATPAGELRADLTWDGLHLDDPGYELLANRLDPLLPRTNQEP